MNRIDMTNGRFKVTKMLDFEILESVVTDSGVYYCMHNNQIKSFYYIYVIDNEPFRVLVKASQTNSKPLKDWPLENDNLKLTTEWSKWSGCNKCGKVGIRQRHGICTIKVG